MKKYVSISLRLTLWFGSIFFLGWVIFGTAMWFNLRQTLTTERHQTLSRRADRLEQLLAANAEAPEPARTQVFRDFAHATGNGLSEIFRPDGSRLYPSPSSAAASFTWPAITPDRREHFLRIHSGDQPYWVLIRPFKSGDVTSYVLMAAPDAGSLLVLYGFWRGLLASIPILLLISSAGGYWVSRRALLPVDRITAAARSLSIRNLSERLPVQPSGDELQRLTETCNDMLGRLESAVNTIRQFTADASHELRGPLSFTRTVAEVALRNPRIDRQSQQAFQDIVDEAANAAILLEQMLTLARSDSEPFGKALEPVDLVAVFEDTCTFARRVAAEKNLTLNISPAPRTKAPMLGDATDLRRLLWILLDNALKYTDAPGSIHASILADSARATITIRDTGTGISPTDLPHIFDRFYRADRSRSQVDGAGLGLAIAKWIVDTHHGDISVTSREHEGTIFTVIFPLGDVILPAPHLTAIAVPA